MTGSFHGRRVLVTGAANGIGLATLVQLAAEGARVAALDRDAAALESLPERLGQALGHAAAVNVADGAVVAGAVKASAAALGGLDGVVNAAGVDLYADIEAMAHADWERVLAVNLTGPFLVIQAAYPFLKAAGGGTIVNVSSAAGLTQSVQARWRPSSFARVSPPRFPPRSTKRPFATACGRATR